MRCIAGWTGSPASAFSAQRPRLLQGAAAQLRRVAQRGMRLLGEDWRGSRYLCFGLLLLALAGLVVAAFYLNHPQVEIDPDTQSYLTVTQHILTNGKFVDPIRTPGYPSFIALVFLLAGQGNLAAVSIAQGILFVVATLEVYIITCLILRHAWMGVIVGLIVGTNTYLLGFVKPDIAEGFGLWVVVSLALAVTLFLLTLRARLLWLVAALLLVAFMTHPEWIYAPVPIFAYLLIFAWRRGKLRRLLPHAVAAVLLLYGCLGLFVYVNTTQNGFPGITDVQGINLLGKVIEYRMQNEAPAQYAVVTQKLDAYLATAGEPTPYGFADYYPPIASNYWSLADSYASSIVSHHPVEFFLDTIPVFFTSSNFYYAYSGISAQGAFSSPLAQLEQVSSRVYFFYRFFPLFALLWLGLLFWRPTRRVQMMGALSLLGLYELAVVAAGGYSDFTRLHVPFDPIMLVVIWGSLLLFVKLLLLLLKRIPLRKSLARFWPTIKWAWGIVLVGGLILSMAATVLLHGLAPLAHPTTWTGLHTLLDHPLWTLALLGVGGILSRLAYLGYQEQQASLAPAASASEQAREESMPQMEEALGQRLEAEHLP